MRTCARRHTAGFTLVEIVVAMLVMVILVAVAVPRFTSLRDRLALRSAGNALVGALAEKRFEVIKADAPLAVNFNTIISEMPTFATVSTAPTMGVGGGGTAGVVTLEPTLGMLANPADAGRVVLSAHAYKVQFSINALGQSSLCTPAGATTAGFDAC